MMDEQVYMTQYGECWHESPACAGIQPNLEARWLIEVATEDEWRPCPACAGRQLKEAYERLQDEILR